MTPALILLLIFIVWFLSCLALLSWNVRGIELDIGSDGASLDLGFDRHVGLLFWWTS